MERPNRTESSNNNANTNENNSKLDGRNPVHSHQSSAADNPLNAHEILGTIDELTRRELFSPIVQVLRSNESSSQQEQNAERTTDETQNVFQSTSVHRLLDLQRQQHQQQEGLQDLVTQQDQKLQQSLVQQKQPQWNYVEESVLPIAVSESSHSAYFSGINQATVSAVPHSAYSSGINQTAASLSAYSSGINQAAVSAASLSAYSSEISQDADSVSYNSDNRNRITLEEIVRKLKKYDTALQSLNLESDLIDLVSSQLNFESADAATSSSQTVLPQECASKNIPLASSANRYDHRLNHRADDETKVLQRSPRSNALNYSNSKCFLHPKYPTRMYCLEHKVAVCCFCCISIIGPHSHENSIPVPKYNTGVEGEKWHAHIKYLSLIVENAIYKLGFWFNINVPVENGENGHLVFKTSFADTDTFTMTPDVKFFLERLNKIINTISVYETCHIEFGKEIKAVLQMFLTMPEFGVIKPKVRNIPTLSSVPVDVSKCFIVGQGTKEMIAGYQTRFFVVTKDPEGNPCDVNKIPYSLIVEISGKRVATGNGPYYKKGVIEILLKHDVVQECRVTIKINNECVPGTPLNVTIRPCTNFFKQIHFKTNLSNPAGIDTPFGSCIDWKSECIFISDQGSNSITVYTLSPQYPNFKCNFTGSLSKPTGVAIDLDGNLVVCDQGNDRVQVFTPDGHPIRESSSNIKLKKPWYVAVNSKNEYIVTHSDYMVTIMTSTFTLVQELKMPGDVKKSTALRGLCTSFLDDIFVTDLATGNVYVADTDTGNFELAFPNRRSLNWNAELFVPSQPQNISTDRAGYIIIPDFSNMCVDVYTHSGDLLSTFEVNGNPTSVVPLDNMSQYMVTLANGDCKVQIFEHTT